MIGAFIYVAAGLGILLVVACVIERELRIYREVMRAEAPRRTLDNRWAWDFDEDAA